MKPFPLNIGCYILLCCFSHLHTHAASIDIFDQQVLHEIRVTTTNPDWYEVLWQNYQNAQNGEGNKFIKTATEIDGELLENVGFRMRGNYSNTGFPGKKKPFRLDFDKYVDNRLFQGLEKLNLNNLAGDPSFLRELVSYNLMKHIGAKASRCSFTKLYINQVYWGCYLILEEPDEHFVRKNFGVNSFTLIENKGNTLLNYKGNTLADYPEFGVQYSNMSDQWENYDLFIRSVHAPQSVEYAADLQKYFRLGEYFRIMATDAFISNYDSYATNRRNFFLLNDETTGKITWIPYDYNMTFWNVHFPPFPRLRGSSFMAPLVWNIHENESLKNDYLTIFCGLISNDFQSFPLEQTAKNAFEVIKEAVLEDTLKFYSNDDFLKNQAQSVNVHFKLDGNTVPVHLPSVIQHYHLRLNQMKYLINQEGVNCEQPEASELAAAVYPNPADDHLNLTFTGLQNESEKVNVSIYSIQGVLVRNDLFPSVSEASEILLDDLKAGNYWVKITVGDRTKTISIIKH